MPLTGHFDLIASFYDRIFGLPSSGPLQELLALPISGRLLDVGGGTGRVAQTLRHQVGQIIILDNSAGMLQQAIIKGLATVQGEVERLPFPDDCFSRILVVDALHHFRHQTQAARELLRVLSSQGRLVIEEPNVRRWAVKVVALAEKMALMRSHFSGLKRAAKLFEEWGGKVTFSKEEGFYFWLVVQKRND
ncbi:MAG: class I SAM-dependent methyltransferase [Anaerolineae bacterium]